MLQQKIEAQRIIGSYGEANGPTVIILGGVHGNEPSAIYAMQTVFEHLERELPPFRGKFVGVTGNLAAIERSMRYLEQDLNRMWTPAKVNELLESPLFGNDLTAEHAEQRALYNLFQDYIRDAVHPVYILDFHTTSSESPPFVILADTIRNRKLGLTFGVPLILGLEELLEGTIMHYAGDLGLCTLALESGQHNDERSIQRHISATWLSLVSTGCLAAEDVPDYESHQKRMKDATRQLSPVFEVRYRYGVKPNEEFYMSPGFKNFQSIKKGQLLASNRDGEIFNHLDGNIFMPLYQSQGNDGYFIIRPVSMFWLKLSEWMRKLKFEKIIPILPGIQRSPESATEFIVNRKIARWLVIEIFHLLGYRRKRIENGKLVVTRRKFDFHGPEEIRDSENR